MRLTLGSRSYDLTTRALVLGTGADAAGDGADLVELAGPDASVPVCAAVTDEASLARAIAAGVALVRLPRPAAADLYRRCAAAGLAVVVPDADTRTALDAGLPPDRILAGARFLDVTRRPCPLAATVAGVLGGARLVRTDEVGAARRVRDVLAAIQEATSP
ncbi:MAG TPA: hypothetical protein VHT97_14630 [Acidimicrobiales bacterium]|jgi:hypothetical protein|nr:hypothetical protein [Acidimicrobiales bacterium]